MGGPARFFAGFGIAAAFALVFGYVAVVTAYEQVKPAIEREYPTQLYEREDECRTPCGSVQASDGFAVAAGINEVHFVVYAVLDDTSGPARVTVVDPSGDIRYDRTFTPQPMPARATKATQDAVTWSGEQGDWTLARTYAGTAGVLQFEVWGEGLPAGTL